MQRSRSGSSISASGTCARRKAISRFDARLAEARSLAFCQPVDRRDETAFVDRAPQIGACTPYSSQIIRLVKPTFQPTGRSPRAHAQGDDTRGHGIAVTEIETGNLHGRARDLANRIEGGQDAPRRGFRYPVTCAWRPPFISLHRGPLAGKVHGLAKAASGRKIVSRMRAPFPGRASEDLAARAPAAVTLNSSQAAGII